MERAVEKAKQASKNARLRLALGVMSRTNQEHRDLLFAMGPPLSTELILAWAAEEVVSASQV